MGRIREEKSDSSLNSAQKRQNMEAHMCLGEAPHGQLAHTFGLKMRQLFLCYHLSTHFADIMYTHYVYDNIRIPPLEFVLTMCFYFVYMQYNLYSMCPKQSINFGLLLVAVF